MDPANDALVVYFLDLEIYALYLYTRLDQHHVDVLTRVPVKK